MSALLQPYFSLPPELQEFLLLRACHRLQLFKTYGNCSILTAESFRQGAQGRQVTKGGIGVTASPVAAHEPHAISSISRRRRENKDGPADWTHGPPRRMLSPTPCLAIQLQHTQGPARPWSSASDASRQCAHWLPHFKHWRQLLLPCRHRLSFLPAGIS